MKRSAGILLPIFSLPSEYGIGSLGAEARAFANFLQDAGQSWWQILPVGPAGAGDSPYASESTFAGNPLFIDLDLLGKDGLLTEEELPDLFENQDILEHEIQIRSLANGVYRIKLARISEKSSVLWRLGMMGKEAAPDIGDIQVLRRVIFPEISTLEKTVKEHQLVFHVRLLPNETLFVNLYPIRLD